MGFLTDKLFYQKLVNCPAGENPVALTTNVTGNSTDTGTWKYDASSGQYHFNLKVKLSTAQSG